MTAPLHLADVPSNRMFTILHKALKFLKQIFATDDDVRNPRLFSGGGRAKGGADCDGDDDARCCLDYRNLISDDDASG